MDLDCLTVTKELDGLYCFSVGRDYLLFVFIEPIILKLIELFVVCVHLFLKCFKAFFEDAHLQGQVIEDLCGH